MIETPAGRRQANAGLEELSVVVGSAEDNFTEAKPPRKTAEHELVETGALGRGIRSRPSNIHVSRRACS